MKNTTILWANLKRQKGSFIGIFLLMFIITVTLSSVLSIWSNSKGYVENEMKRISYGDIIYWTYDGEICQNIKEEIQNVDGVRDVQLENILYLDWKINGKDSKSNMFVKEYNQKVYEYKVFEGKKSKYQKFPEELASGEVYVPISFVSIYHTEIGQKVETEIAGNKKEYTIKGFYEDPCEGSSLMGIKNILMIPEDVREIKGIIQDAGENIEEAEGASGKVIHVFAKKHVSPAQAKSLQKEINEKTRVKDCARFAYTSYAMATFMVSLQNIFIGVLLGFVAVLLLVSVIVIGHSISSTIEQTYVDFGILKAVGYTSTRLCFIQCLQYSIILILGVVGGLFCATALIGLINQLILPVTGIMIPDKIPMNLACMSFGGMAVIFVLFIISKVQIIGKIKPIVAIRGGREEVFFENRFQPKMHRTGLQFWLAVRQIFSSKKQYLGTMLIAALLVFFLSMCGKAQSWLGPEGEGLKNSMGVASIEGKSYDFAIHYEDKETRKGSEAIIEKNAKILGTYQTQNVTGQINQSDYVLNVISKPELLHLLKGRYCEYDNEITITQVIAKELKLEIGDTVTVSAGSNEGKYIISGIHECANDMGANFIMCFEGYKRISDGNDYIYQNYVLKDSSNKKTIEKSIKDKYQKKVYIDSNEWSGVKGIVSATRALQYLMYVICIIFIFVVVFMTGGKMLHREQHDLGVYKALGFKSFDLRISFALRFAMVAIAGSGIGCLMGQLVTDKIMGMAFSLMGVGTFETTITIKAILTPVVLVTAVCFVFALILGRRIRKADPGILIVE